MSHDEFQKLFKYVEERLDKNEATISADIASLRDEVRVGFDQVAARLDDDDTERAAYEAQSQRHETWINELADTTKTKLALDA